MILRVLLNGAYTSGEKLAIILPQIAAVLVIIFLILPLHEWAHGFVAHKLGDDTAKREGRLTFNPIASIDPIGALFILLFGFGWAKPVPINPNNFKHRRSGMALTALAGPVVSGGNVDVNVLDRIIDKGLQENGRIAEFSVMMADKPENNPVMFELLYELPWRAERFSPDVWLQGYLKARYGGELSPEVMEAWRALEHTVYNASKNSPGEGTLESLLCARPGFHLDRTSTWGYSKLFYSPDSTSKAADLMLSVAEQYKGNNNFEYLLHICKHLHKRLGSMKCAFQNFIIFLRI